MADTTTTTTHANATGTAQQSNSPFLRLPAELRNRIYELVLASRRPIMVSPDIYTPHPGRKAAGAQPPLTLTCRALRTEALPIFYSSNNFVVAIQDPRHESRTRAWLEAIGSRNREHLHHVHILCGNWHFYLRDVEAFRRAQSRFLKRMKYPGEKRIAENRYYVVKIDCLTLDD